MTESSRPHPEIRILFGDPDAEEIAAVTAVLSAALEELGGEQRRRQSAGPSAWQRSQRSVRTPLVRGAWRSLGR
ncbi:MAG TPA: acyl-CoA carboxylase subunit epsilon [Solirubrobacteraceae bacterium]|nr:acyl-CoA carboxylase subunit epsilon [Solirubrobacteraceae bacterium]